MNTAGEKLGQWSLERIRYLLGHIEGFVDSNTDPDRELKARARDFVPQTGLEQVERLTLTEPNDPRLPTLVLERLAAFFDAGALLQRGPARGWYVTDLFGRGTTFHLELETQVRAEHVVPELTPLQVHHADAAGALDQLGLGFLLPAPGARAYLIKPTPTLGYLLISDLAAPFAVDHVARAHELINQCFIY